MECCFIVLFLAVSGSVRVHDETIDGIPNTGILLKRGLESGSFVAFKNNKSHRVSVSMRDTYMAACYTGPVNHVPRLSIKPQFRFSLRPVYDFHVSEPDSIKYPPARTL